MQSFEVGAHDDVVRTVTAADVEAFAVLTGDVNPVHLDEAYAAQTRFGRRIAHGMLAVSLISAVLGTRLPGPGAIYLSQSAAFKAPVYIGDTVTARVSVVKFREDKGILTLRTECRNQDGTLVVEGEAVVLVERPVDRA